MERFIAILYPPYSRSKFILFESIFSSKSVIFPPPPFSHFQKLSETQMNKRVLLELKEMIYDSRWKTTPGMFAFA